jgi:PAS domain S-box-containing protein
MDIESVKRLLLLIVVALLPGVVAAVLIALSDGADLAICLTAAAVSAVLVGLLNVKQGQVLEKVHANCANLRRELEQREVDLLSKNGLLARYHLIVENSQDAIMIKDPEGRYLLANGRVGEMLGHDVADIIGKTDIDLFGEEIGKGLQGQDHLVFEEGKVQVFEETMRIGDVERVFESTRIPVGVDTVVASIGICRDITEAAETQDALASAAADADQAAKAKSAFLANMSHEIRTPMNGVLGMCNLLLDTRLDEQQRDYASTIRTSADALLTIINDILDFSKIEAGRMELEQVSFDPLTVAEEAIDLLAARAQEKGIFLGTLVGARLPERATGDPGRIRQVLLNLISNAIKFTEYGSVRVELDAQEDEAGDARLIFRVVDSGIGIAPDRVDTLFDAFSQADVSTARRFSGSGLGLAISRELVHLMDGSVRVDSALGSGSTFTVSIPCVVPVGATLMGSEVAGLRAATIIGTDAVRASVHALLRHLHVHEAPADEVPNGMLTIVEASDAAAALAVFRHSGGENPRSLLPLLPSGTRVERTVLEELGIKTWLQQPVKASALEERLSLLAGRRERSRSEEIDQLDRTHTDGTVLRVLLAEDNAVNQKVAKGLIERMGHRWDIAGNGLEAVHALEQFPYDMVIMDCQMPEMDGFTATRTIRNLDSPVQNHAVPIIAMTASALKTIARPACPPVWMTSWPSR